MDSVLFYYLTKYFTGLVISYLQFYGSGNVNCVDSDSTLKEQLATMNAETNELLA